jgi:hypothetical protein
MGLENSTIKNSHNLPGGPLPEWHLYMPKMHRNVQGQLVEIGMTTPAGEFYHFTEGESLSLDRNGGKRVPYIKMASGDKLPFEVWKKMRIEKFQALLEKVNPDYRAIYMQALHDFPELEQIEIRAGDRKKDKVLEKTDGFFRKPEDISSSPVIVMDMEKDDQKYQQLIQDRKTSVDLCANMLGISAEDIVNNPRILKLFIFLHELGHGHDWINQFQKKMLSDKSFNAVEKWEERSDQELRNLPVPTFDLTMVIRYHEEGKLAGYYEENGVYYRNIGINSLEELIIAQEKAYRNLPKESYADNFAKNLLLKYWEKLNLEKK